MWSPSLSGIGTQCSEYDMTKMKIIFILLHQKPAHDTKYKRCWAVCQRKTAEVLVSVSEVFIVLLFCEDDARCRLRSPVQVVPAASWVCRCRRTLLSTCCMMSVALPIQMSGLYALDCATFHLFRDLNLMCLLGLLLISYAAVEESKITLQHTRPCYAKSSYRLVDHLWKRPPGRTRAKWTDQLRRDNNVPIATLWSQAIGCSHSRATLLSQPTTR